MINFILLVVGLILLIKCADIFVDGSSNVAKAFGIPSLIIGLTIVAFGTSAPELAVSVTAAIKGSSDISVGNVVGSNICNALLILGLSSLFCTLKPKDEVKKRDFPYYLLCAFVLFVIAADFFIAGQSVAYISRASGIILLCFFILYLISLVGNVKENQKNVKKEERTKFKLKDVLFIILSLCGIVFGGQLVVNGATAIAQSLGVSEKVIALTIVAIGTSLPELVTSVIAAKKGETDIAVGNVVGSNIFNILLILGISSVITPLTLDFATFMDIIVMFVSGIIVYLMMYKNNSITRKKRNGIFVNVYSIYCIYTNKIG